MAGYVFPTSEQLTAIAQEKLPQLTQDDPIFTLFPITAKNMINLKWEQKDSYKGLQQLRGIGGEPQRVQKVGMKSYLMEPGVYGEYAIIDEKEMLERRPIGTWDGFVDLTDLVMDLQDQLLNRRVDRIRWIMWTLLVNGAFYVPLPTGAIGHMDQYAYVTAIGQFGMQQAVAATPWSTFATSQPLQDLRNLQTTNRGRSIDFGPNGSIFINRSTWFNLVRNTNPQDFGGKKSQTRPFSTITSLTDLNEIMVDADLPQFVIYDRTYIDDNGVAQLFIPNGTAIVVGARTNGDPLGEYFLTRNTNNPGMGAGAYQMVIDRGAGPYPQIPRNVEVHDGHNGGPALYYPSAIVRLTGL